MDWIYRILIFFISNVLIVAVVKAMMPAIRKREKEDAERAGQKRVVQLDRTLRVMFRSVFLSAALVGLLLAFGWQWLTSDGDVPETLLVILLFILGVCLLIFLLLAPILWLKVSYDDEGFVCHRVYGKKRAYSYEDVVEVSRAGLTGMNIKIRLKDGKTYTLLNTFHGKELFLAKLQNKR